MAAKKTSLRTDQISPEILEFLASRFKVLAEPMRLRILHELQQGERTVTQIIEGTEANQANVSKHLGILTRAGMVSRRKEGLNAYYSISDPAIFELCDFVCNKLRTKLVSSCISPNIYRISFSRGS